MEHYSSFCTFEIAILANVLGHYLRKYGILFLVHSAHLIQSYLPPLFITIISRLFNNHDHFHPALLIWSFTPCLFIRFQKKFSPACLFWPACLWISQKLPACLLILVCSCIRDFRVSYLPFIIIRTFMIIRWKLEIWSEIYLPFIRLRIWCGYSLYWPTWTYQYEQDFCGSNLWWTVGME